MVSTPSLETIEPFYQLVRGIGPVIGNLPLNVLEVFEQESRVILAEHKDQTACLLCLASLARITRSLHGSHAQEVVSPEGAFSTSRHGSRFQTWLLNIHKYFGSERGHKTLGFITLRVISSCSMLNSVSVEDERRHILLAKDVLDSVDTREIDSWIQRKTAVIDKLHLKMQGLAMQPELQSAVSASIG